MKKIFALLVCFSLILSFSLSTHENYIEAQDLQNGIGGEIIFINAPGGPY